jgi:hypothetical protein
MKRKILNATGRKEKIKKYTLDFISNIRVKYLATQLPESSKGQYFKPMILRAQSNCPSSKDKSQTQNFRRTRTESLTVYSF